MIADASDPQRHGDARSIAERPRGIFAKHGIEKAVLFGSFATGRQSRGSDVDLLLIQETDRRYFDRFQGILRELYAALPGRDWTFSSTLRKSRTESVTGSSLARLCGKASSFTSVDKNLYEARRWMETAAEDWDSAGNRPEIPAARPSLPPVGRGAGS